jgi:hypothetical protein
MDEQPDRNAWTKLLEILNNLILVSNTVITETFKKIYNNLLISNIMPTLF